MKVKLMILGVSVIIFLSLIYINPGSVVSQPSFNGSAPGCAGGSCHTLQDGITTVAGTAGLQVQVMVNGVSSGSQVAGELVDANGTVVDVNNGTTSNPFTLTAPTQGEYTINAGFRRPSREWDSVMVSLGTTGIGDPHSGVVSGKFELFPNHPNPFNNETIIQFSVPTRSNVELNIYNIGGQLVRRLASANYPSGVHSVRWDGRNNYGQLVASGIYLYELRAGNVHQVRQLILTK